MTAPVTKVFLATDSLAAGTVTGGDEIFTINSFGTFYEVHTFSTTGTATFTTDVPLEIEALLVGGGGGGGADTVSISPAAGGGGGGGGVASFATALAPGSYEIVVGAGGAGGSGGNGGNGGVSRIGPSTAPLVSVLGGGGGGSGYDSAGSNGASGGGGADGGAAGLGTAGQGNNGGAGVNALGGGGGGADQVGQNGSVSAEKGGDGGAGRLSAITGIGRYFGGGGGGSVRGFFKLPGAGGLGGGGAGGSTERSEDTNFGRGVPGEPNTGGGGGASSGSTFVRPPGAPGGSGFVAIRYKLTLEEISADAKSVSVRRGRSDQLENFDAGAVSVTLNNFDRQYDPAAGPIVAPFGESMKPRRGIIVTSDDVPIFTGLVEDWNIEYDLGGNHTATVLGSDAFTILASINLERVQNSVELSGARVEKVLDLPSIIWPSDLREISPGKTTLQADIISDEQGDEALAYLQQVEISEPGALFIGKDGSLIFRDRADLQLDPVSFFSDDGTGLPFSTISVSYGIEEMKNRATVSIANEGGSSTVTNEKSIQDYGLIDFTIDDSLVLTVLQAKDLAAYLVNSFGEPQVRVDALSVNLGDLDDAKKAEILDLELGDVVEVFFTPSNIGDRIAQKAVIDAIEHEVSPLEHVMSFNLSDSPRIGLILDSVDFGVLDVNKLGF
jgi:hypothetical protein